MNLVSLLVLPAVITLRHNDTARFLIAGIALAVLLGAIAFSKRSTGPLEAETQERDAALPHGAPTPEAATSTEDAAIGS
jgi:hypothetical protein